MTVRVSGYRQRISFDSEEFNAVVDKGKKLLKDLAVRPEVMGLATTEHQQFLDKVLDESDFLEAIWTNDVKGRFIYSCPPAGIFSGVTRQWWREAMQGRVYQSEPYISAITKKPCLTISQPIVNQFGENVGVIGCDLAFSR